MPDLDLEPNEWRRRRPLSLPLAWAYVAFDVAFLAWIYFTRSGSLAEWFLTILLSAAGGILLAGIMRNID